MTGKYTERDNSFVEYVKDNQGVTREAALIHTGLEKNDFNLMIKRLTVISCGAIMPIRKGGIRYYTPAYAKENGITKKSFIDKNTASHK